MGFKTKLDYSNNRQITQRERTLTYLSGTTEFGVPFSALTSGVDTSTRFETYESPSTIFSTFTGDNTTTNINWGDSRMSLFNDTLSAITPSTSAFTQTSGDIYVENETTIIDGNNVVLTYSGVSFSFDVGDFIDLGSGSYSGNIYTNDFVTLSASSLDYKGRTIWVDNTEISRTDRLIIKRDAQPGYIFTCVDDEGMGTWLPNSGSTSGNTNSLWEESSGILSLIPKGSNNVASGRYSLAEGFETEASGDFSHAEGLSTIASGFASHAEGVRTQAGNTSHAEGYDTIASGTCSHAEGNNTVSSGDYSHAEGYFTVSSGFYSHAEGVRAQAIGQSSHAEGYFTVSSGFYSHAEGNSTIAIGQSSHAEGYDTIASGNSSHAEGRDTIASGDYSHAEGQNTQAIGDASHAEGFLTQAIGTASYAGGRNTQAVGEYSHAENQNSIASGRNSHAGGFNSIVNSTNGFIHSLNSTLEATAINSVLLGGEGLTGSSANTVYVPDLIIDGLTSVTDLQTDASGRLVDGVSDVSLKENIKTIDSALDKIKKLRGVSFDWSEESNMGKGINFGLIAQEVNEVIPEMVKSVKKNKNKLTLDYKSLIPWLIEAIKEISNDNITFKERTIETETIASEDNDILLNFNGNHETSLYGGLIINKGVNEEVDSQFIINSDGDWVSNTYLIPNGIVIPEYTPHSSYDSEGKVGEMTRDNNYLYIKDNNNIWKRIKLENF